MQAIQIINPSIRNIKAVNFSSSLKHSPAIKSVYCDSFERTNYITPHISNEMFEKAKDIVIKSLFDKNPKESVVLIRNNEILFQSTGSEFEAEIPEKVMDNILDSGSGDIVIIHSHTPEKTGLTAPISLADIENMIDNNSIKSICAINKNGEYSIIEAKPNRKYKYNLCMTMDEKCQAGLVHLFKGKKKREYIKFLKSLGNFEQMRKDETIDEFFIRMEKANDMLDEYYDYATGLRDFPEYMEKFWKKYAQEFGFNYYSNFSF